MNTAIKKIILASSSTYRRDLLKRLQIDFECKAPNIDETALAAETPDTLVRRLALSKASALADSSPNSIIIGSDQVAVLKNTILGKAGAHEKAKLQLQNCSGQKVVFHTGLCVLDTTNQLSQVDNIQFTVRFRELTDDVIEQYLAKEPAFDAAGSFKAEGLGITLFQALQGEDPTALIGLPLIRLTDMLKNVGIALP